MVLRRLIIAVVAPTLPVYAGMTLLVREILNFFPTYVGITLLVPVYESHPRAPPHVRGDDSAPSDNCCCGAYSPPTCVGMTPSGLHRK